MGVLRAAQPLSTPPLSLSSRARKVTHLILAMPRPDNVVNWSAIFGAETEERGDMNDSKAALLNALAEEVRQLKDSPLAAYRRENDYQMVFGEGDVDARIMFIGEAPGAQEAKTGRPFVGAAGGVLDDLLASIGLDREAVYITNVVKDRPPDNRDPRKAEIERYAPFLRQQIEIIQPRVIATLGRFAMTFVLKEFDLPHKGKKIGDLHGQILQTETAYGEVSIVPLYHPAAVFYNRGLQETLEADFEVLKQFE
jgi:DNA polymerase